MTLCSTEKKAAQFGWTYKIYFTTAEYCQQAMPVKQHLTGVIWGTEHRLGTIYYKRDGLHKSNPLQRKMYRQEIT